MTDELDQLTSTLADRYTIERPIGRGGMATVYLAEELHPQRQVAIKVLDQSLGGSIIRERFLREVELVSQLTHPHIVPIFAAGEAEGILYYVMPYIAGASLRHRLSSQGSLSLDDAIRVTSEVADVLAYAHSLEIVHRDIKPENILFEAGHAVVTDFGIARVIHLAGVGHLTQEGVPIGTPAYMSPEQASGMSDVDGRADIYSLACVLLEMLAGRQPFWGRSPGSSAYAERQELTSYQLGIPGRVEDAVQKALAWDPDDRYQSATDFAEALADLHCGTPSCSPSQRATAAPEEVSPKSIAVLPFANMSADSENEYFSDGITDDIITHLSKIGDLRVTSRTSAMHYKNSDKSLRTIGGELGVANVLEGSVRRAGDRVRITSQLIDVSTDAHLWAETYDRDLTDIFEIQSDVAGQIANALEATLSPATEACIKRQPTQDLEAYNLYLKGLHHWHRFVPESGRKALECFEQAIHRDPDFALAHAGLANAYWMLALAPDDSPLSPTEAYKLAKGAAEDALRIDPTLSDAHATLGSVHSCYEWDWDAAEAAFTRANSHSTCCDAPRIKHGFFLAAMGRHDEAIGESQEALKLDPVSLSVGANLAAQYYWARQYDRAIGQALETLELDTSFLPARLHLGLAYLQLGDHDNAVHHLESVVQIAGRTPCMLAPLGTAYAAAERVDDANGVLGEIEALSPIMYVSPRVVAAIYAWLGQPEVALDWLDRAYDQHAPLMAFVNVDPVWDPLRAEPRFDAIVDKMNFPAT